MLTLLAAAAEEVHAPVTGAMVFKNGVSAVRRSVEPGKLVEFDLACDIQPLEGSIWYSSPVLSVVRQQVKKPVAGTYPISNITKTFAGKTVTLTVAQGNDATQEVSGTVWDPKPDKARGDGIIWLKRNDGSFVMIQPHLVRALRSSEEPKAAALPETADLRPVWHFTLERPAEKAFWVDYLSKGLQWQNAYRIELDKDRKMTVFQDVEIVNNLADLNKVTLYLASGFANFININTTSPMAMIQQQKEVLQEDACGFSAEFSNQMAAGARMNAQRNYAPAKHFDLGSTSTGESEDISVLPVENLTLKKGEVCHRVIGSAETTYERLVHWTIPARREALYGRTYGHQKDAVPMDALRFTNPFSRPMTTSPVEIRDGGMVLAQVKTQWVNPKQVTTLDITRALSLTGKVVEYEVPAQKTDAAEALFYSVERNKAGKIISGWIAGSRYRITDVQGEIRLRNYRENPARLLIELDYSGTLVSAEGEPNSETLDRTSSVNPNSRLIWDLTLPAGGEKVIKYRYNLLVNF